MESTEFPVGRLLNGDSYKTPTRIKNISSAMNWIQKQMESVRESDKQLLSLFGKLESDMVDLKTLCSEGGRGRAASVSSIGMSLDISNSSTGQRYTEGYMGFSSNVKILEESMNDYQLDRTSSNGSLENFADLLGEDDIEDSVPRTSLKSQGSNFSDFNSNLSLHDNDRISGGGGDMRALDDALSMTSQSSGSSTRLNITNSSPHMPHVGIAKNHSHYSSNDSGALVDSEPNIIIPPKTTTVYSGGSITSTSILSSNDSSSLTATLTDSEEAKRLSGIGLAGEIFALLNMK